MPDSERSLSEQVESVQNISARAAEEIKQIVMSELQDVADKLPTLIFGVRNNELSERVIVEGSYDTVDVTARAVNKRMSAVVLDYDDQFWTRAFVVVLTTEGIFKCGFVMSEPEDAQESRKRHHSVLIEARPDWVEREEGSDLWLKYGVVALHSIYKLKN